MGIPKIIFSPESHHPPHPCISGEIRHHPSAQLVVLFVVVSSFSRVVAISPTTPCLLLDKFTAPEFRSCALPAPARAPAPAGSAPPPLATEPPPTARKTLSSAAAPIGARSCRRVAVLSRPRRLRTISELRVEVEELAGPFPPPSRLFPPGPAHRRRRPAMSRRELHSGHESPRRCPRSLSRPARLLPGLVALDFGPRTAVFGEVRRLSAMRHRRRSAPPLAHPNPLPPSDLDPAAQI